MTCGWLDAKYQESINHLCSILFIVVTNRSFTYSEHTQPQSEPWLDLVRFFAFGIASNQQTKGMFSRIFNFSDEIIILNEQLSQLEMLLNNL